MSTSDRIAWDIALIVIAGALVLSIGYVVWYEFKWWRRIREADRHEAELLAERERDVTQGQI